MRTKKSISKKSEKKVSIIPIQKAPEKKSKRKTGKQIKKIDKKQTKKKVTKSVKKQVQNNVKQISNPSSTGNSGPHFENCVQSAFTVLMLTGGVAPSLPAWPISEIKLQGKYQGFNTDDFIVYCKSPNSERTAKLLGQIKHTIKFTSGDQTLHEVLVAAWEDFNNKKIYSEESQDSIALISGPLSAIDTDSVRPLLEQARKSCDGDDFFIRINRAIFTSDGQRNKLNVFKIHLRSANNDIELTNDQLWRFLKSFHLLIYDLDMKGVVLSLLHTLIEQYSQNNAKAIWTQINDHVQWVNQSAGFITISNIPVEIKEAFKRLRIEVIPQEYVKDTSKIEISDWNDYQNASDLAIASIVGSWDENSPADKSILSQLAHLEYEKWIPKLRDVLLYKESPIEFKNGIWHVKDRIKLWQSLGSRIFDEHLEILKKCAISVLTERNPKFELPQDSQFAAQIYGKVLNYSIHLRKGLSEALALTNNFTDSLNNCSSGKPETIAILTIREIFSNSDWVLWASLNDLLPTLAEAAPDEFIKIVETNLVKESTLFSSLFAQEGDGITGWNYITGLLWALETLAWEETFFVHVVVLLGELAKMDPGGNWANRPSNSLTTIFLPWLPQTTATIDKRKVAITTLDKELPDISWNLLLTLLPTAHQISSYTRKPIFRNSIPKDWNGKVTKIDYWRQVEFFVDLAIEKAKDNLEKLEKLIANLDNLPQPAFEKLLSHLSTETILSQPDETKVTLWNALVDFTTKHKRFSDAQWALGPELVAQIDEVARKLEPRKSLYLFARLFSERDMDLYEEKGNWQEQYKKLEERRQQALKILFAESGIEILQDFLNTVDSQTKVGSALGYISDDSIDEKVLPLYLDSDEKKIIQFISAYISTKCFNLGWVWVDRKLNKPWSKIQLSRFLTYLPFTTDTWKRVNEKLSESESLYWENTYVNPYQTDCDLALGIEKLIKYGRPHAAIDCIYKEIYDHKPLNINKIIVALKAGLNSQEPVYTMDSYHITEIIKTLQNDNSVNREDLVSIEWAYLPLLDEHSGVTPTTLETELASSPAFFCEVIQFIYRSKKISKAEQIEPSEKDKAIATNGWHLLRNWKTPPGYGADGSFDEVCFKKWFDDIWKKCDESGHLEVALIFLGEVLFYTPADPDGFWINKTVASTLNGIDTEELREGFASRVHNSRGVFWVDPTAKPELELANQYRIKAEETENAGYQRFAVTLRKIADYYGKEAKRIIDEHQQNTLE